MKKPRTELLLPGLIIEDISSEGKAVARHEGMVVFIEGAVPGDIVDAAVYRKKKNFAEARVEKLVKASEWRTEPRCEHFGTCGGCKWQNLSYKKQLNFKQKYVHDALTRIGKLEFPEIQPIISSSEEYFYRNKLEFSFSNKRWLTKDEMNDAETKINKNALGFHLPGMFDKILDIRNCYLQPEPSNSIRNAVKKYALEKNLSFFDIRNRTGFLRTLMIRTSSEKETMVVLSVYEWLEKELHDLLNFISVEFPEITSLQYTHNNKGNDTLTDLDIKTWAGRDHIIGVMEGLKFKVSARSFYQTNSVQALELYKVTRDFAGLNGSEIVYDLYTGTGSIANFIASRAKKVVGIEYVNDAVADAEANSALNSITNTSFFAGDMKAVLNEDFFTTHGKPDVVITDPPRAGMDEKVVNAMINAAPEKIVYVSCNPATQARDLALMKEVYHIVKVQPVDMFPQTVHVENVALLEKIKS